MLAARVVEWTEEWKRQGLEEGLEKGLQKGEANLLLRQMELRFGPLDESSLARVRAADAEALLRWGERILTAVTAENVCKG